ncbi:hypothetical protein [Streptomyces lydicus]|uniref:hypothetical protein n=1 Tax=Streptomyces lydicus TaxID=47763 RepID=UPI000A67BC0F|nr:hypothetical protein [Streptomyces lydicus]UEG90790.1 hypothetical protein LJ741_09730 [Streptomyces lydicus]
MPTPLPAPTSPVAPGRRLGRLGPLALPLAAALLALPLAAARDAGPAPRDERRTVAPGALPGGAVHNAPVGRPEKLLALAR